MFRALVSAGSKGYVCGEVKVAITLRLLAGASYLDIVSIFDVHYTHTYNFFHYVLENWIYKSCVYAIDYAEVLYNESKMYEIAKQFSNGRSNGILSGIIGALDGWLVCIRCPSLTHDGVVNPSVFLSVKASSALIFN